MDSTVLGVLVGAIVGVIAPILTSYFSNRFSASKEDRDYNRKLQRDLISATEKLYEDALFYLMNYNPSIIDPDKMVEREETRARYRLRLDLAATPDIVSQFRKVETGSFTGQAYSEEYNKLTQLIKDHLGSLRRKKVY